MLSTETPMNSPNRPPQLAMKSDVVAVSDRFKDMKCISLNMICTLLSAPIKLIKINVEILIALKIQSQTKHG